MTPCECGGRGCTTHAADGYAYGVLAVLDAHSFCVTCPVPALWAWCLCARDQNEVSFKNIREFKKDYYTYFVNMCRKLAKEGKARVCGCVWVWLSVRRRTLQEFTYPIP